MRRFFKKLRFGPIALGLVTLLVGTEVLFSNAGPVVQTQKDPTPAYAFKDIAGHDGQTYSLDQFKGKYVVLEWFNNECPFVKKHYDQGHMQNRQKKYTDQGVIWLTVSSSAPGKQGHMTAAQAKEILGPDQRNAHPTAVLLDEEGVMATKYKASTTPHMFVIDPKGMIVYQGAIDDQPSFRPSTLNGAINYIEAALDALLDGNPNTDVVHTDVAPYGCGIKLSSPNA